MKLFEKIKKIIFKKKINKNEQEKEELKKFKSLDQKNEIENLLIEIESFKKLDKKEIDSLNKFVLSILKSSDTWIKNKQIRGILEQRRNIKIAPITLRKIISNLRNKKYPIIASEKGYLYTEDEKQINQYFQTRMLEIEKEKQILSEILLFSK